MGISHQPIANHLGKHHADWLTQHDSFCFNTTYTCKKEWHDKITLSLFLTISLRHNSVSLIGNKPSYNVVLVPSYISIKSNIISLYRIFSKCFSKCGLQTPVSKFPRLHTKWTGVQESLLLTNTLGGLF